ncbi:2-succinylbenzoate-CoA ligase [Sesbania bispinosa]|nr:2-succinylbenzoate-CoA ligase [Sesbania bispinosa]
MTVAHGGDAAWVLLLDGAVQRSRRVWVTFGGGLDYITTTTKQRIMVDDGGPQWYLRCRDGCRRRG